MIHTTHKWQQMRPLLRGIWKNVSTIVCCSVFFFLFFFFNLHVIYAPFVMTVRRLYFDYFLIPWWQSIFFVIQTFSLGRLFLSAWRQYFVFSFTVQSIGVCVFVFVWAAAYAEIYAIVKEHCINFVCTFQCWLFVYKQ